MPTNGSAVPKGCSPACCYYSLPDRHDLYEARLAGKLDLFAAAHLLGDVADCSLHAVDGHGGLCSGQSFWRGYLWDLV